MLVASVFLYILSRIDWFDITGFDNIGIFTSLLLMLLFGGIVKVFYERKPTKQKSTKQEEEW
jgi:hypothetical protein